MGKTVQMGDFSFVLWRGLCKDIRWVDSPIKCFLNHYPLREQTTGQDVSKFWEFKSVMD